MTGLKKRKDGRYYRHIEVPEPDGSYRTACVYGKTVKELDSRCRELMKLAHSSNEESVTERVNLRNPTFRQLGNIWIEYFKADISEKGRKQYRSYLENYLYPRFGDVHIKSLSSVNIMPIINALHVQGLSYSTMKMVKETASQVMDLAIDNGIVDRNPFRNIKIPKVTPEERREATVLEKHMITQHWEGHRMGLPALIMLYCGLRRGEMVALRWEDIDLENGFIDVNKAAEYVTSRAEIKEPKTKAGTRTVPIPDIVMDALKKRQKKTGYVCPAADGETLMTKVAWKRAWEGYVKYLNVKAGGTIAEKGKPAKWAIGEDLGAHMLRHSYATMLYDANVDVKSAQKYLGHSSVKVTMDVYTHLSKFKKNESIEGLNRYIDNVHNSGDFDEKVVKNAFLGDLENLATESEIMDFER